MAEVQNLIVSCSPRVELMLAAAMLAAPEPSPGHYGTLDHPIAQAARGWFAPYAGHPAMAAVRRLFYVENASAFACDALTSVVLRRGEPPDLAALYPHPGPALAQAGGSAGELDRLVDLLRSFYHASRFASFYDEQAGAYQALGRQVAGYVREGWAGEDAVATMEGYFGQRKAAYALVPTPLERPGGGTLDFPGEEGGSVVACFDATVSREWVLYLLYHEVGHCFVNPLAARYASLVQRYAGLYAPLEAAMRPWGYRDWTTALNEHVLRAQNCRLRRRLSGDEAADAQLAEEEGRGFRYVRALEARLAEYEARRELYPSLADFYPLLLTALEAFVV